MKINVRKSGSNFLLNGKPTKLRMRTSFKFFGWLLHNREGKARRWLERVKRQGFTGIRLFGENQLWDGPFFGLPPVADPYNWNMPAGSGFKISARHKAALRKLVELLQEYDMIAEFTAIATLKDPNYPGDPRDDVVSWNSHLLRATAEELHTIRKQLGSLNMLFETYNEANAHSVKIPWYEMHSEARRWKVRDLPGSLISISNGDHWDYHYDVGDGPNEFSHCVVHTPRHGKWWQIEQPLRELQSNVGSFPVYLNENIHYMTQQQWDYWVPKHPNWGGLSTTDWSRIQQQWNTAYNLGASYCVHDLVGMATDPDVPETPIESEHRHQFGDGVPPPPPPPPPPPGNLTSGPLAVEASSPDSLGRLTFTVRYPKGLFPLLLEGGYERDAKPIAGEHGGEATGPNAGVLRCRYTVMLPDTYDITDINVSHSAAPEKIDAMDTFIYDQYGRAIYVRSDSAKVLSISPTYQKQSQPARTKKLAIHHNLRVASSNKIRGQFTVKIYAQSLGHNSNNNEPPPPPPPPPSGPEPSDYYKLSVGREIINDVRVDSRSDIYVGIWTSVRNLNYAASNCRELIQPTFGISAGDMLDWAKEGDYLLKEFENHWQKRFKTENKRAATDPRFKGRSEVEKSSWGPFENRLRASRAEVSRISGIAQQDPVRQICGYDNVAGWCTCRNRHRNK